jgi:hypothetical protein
VIQASGVAAPTGAANATATTTASALCFTQYVLFIIFLLCLSETLWSLKSAELIRIEILGRAYQFKPLLQCQAQYRFPSLISDDRLWTA